MAKILYKINRKQTGEPTPEELEIVIEDLDFMVETVRQNCGIVSFLSVAHSARMIRQILKSVDCGKGRRKIEKKEMIKINEQTTTKVDYPTFQGREHGMMAWEKLKPIKGGSGSCLNC